MAFPVAKKKGDFLDGVVEEMGPADKGGADEYGADMKDDGDGMDDDSNPEEAEQDRVMASTQIGKALGLSGVDAPKLAAALKAFFDSCS